MITYEEAFRRVMLYTKDFGTVSVPLMESVNCVLAETIYADRDFPPFNRSTKDGIALQHSAFETNEQVFKIEGIIGAGLAQQKLENPKSCLEIMTGAVVPAYADTIVMYEDIEIKDGYATVHTEPVKGQNIHLQGSDKKEGTVLLEKGIRISPAEIGILASVGKASVVVQKTPTVCVISTGDELVPVSEIPKPHQIRTSNVLSLKAALQKENITATHLHLNDNKKVIQAAVLKALTEYDVLLLSGGVSKGKFDFIPEVMDELGVEKVFHKVLQRPGKPFWFGVHEEYNAMVFSFPGNPVSTFSNYCVYFAPWLKNSMGLGVRDRFVVLKNDVEKHPILTLYIPAVLEWDGATLLAKTVANNGSGDLTSLAEIDGFVCLPPGEANYEKGAQVHFIPSK
ncbi:molybdopterin molybdotransferase MoeA [Cellulophaga baltica]|uniref:molybdopterin molybdotransferase MoeA n=1 Tax=Cellulophaga baltica TaxID=76594 RepID=UPI002494A6A2|nr:molybdopterin molybdotransferase MoeA [Cellulophaga baltica]